MSVNILNHLRKLISPGCKVSLAVFLASVALEAGYVQAQQIQTQQPTAPAASVAKSDDSDSDADAARLQDLEMTVAQQQVQIQSLVSQAQQSNGPFQNASQITAPAPSIYPGGTAAGPVAGPVNPAPYVIGSDRLLQGSWTNDGPYFKSKNGDFTFHPRFVAQEDIVASIIRRLAKTSPSRVAPPALWTPSNSAACASVSTARCGTPSTT